MCLAVALVTAVQAQSLSGWAHTRLGQELIVWGPYVVGEPLGVLRTVTAGFLHLDAGHLAINMFMLTLIGREVERFVGSALYAVAYLIGVLGSSAAILWFAPDVPTAGASGALYALMSILVGMTAVQGGDLRAPLVLVSANVVYTFITPAVSLYGHLGGLVAGALVAWPLTRLRRGPQRLLGVVLVGVVVVGLIGGRLAVAF